MLEQHKLQNKFTKCIKSFFWWWYRNGLGVAGLAVLGLTMFFIYSYQLFMGGEWTNTDQNDYCIRNTSWVFFRS